METQMPTTKPVHFEFIDLLRAIAIIGVLLQHSATYMLDVEETFPALFYQKSSKWNILLFIFISGFLLIPKDIPISLMWKKYIKRIIIAFVFWSLLYSIYNAVVLILNGNESGGGAF